jgi:hypothetical protein
MIRVKFRSSSEIKNSAQARIRDRAWVMVKVRLRPVVRFKLGLGPGLVLGIGLVKCDV